LLDRGANLHRPTAAGDREAEAGGRQAVVLFVEPQSCGVADLDAGQVTRSMGVVTRSTPARCRAGQ
jgi:hypothetical protein